MKSFIEFLNESKEQINESSLSRLWRKYKESDSGTISAFRGEYSKEENMERSRKLSSALIGAGYSVTSVNGAYIENYGSDHERKVKEKSFIVFDRNKTGKLKKDLMKLGELYDQDSITFSSVEDGNYYLIGTSKRSDAFPKYHVEMKLGKPMFGKDGEFHSTVKGRPFVFESVCDDEGCYNVDNTILNYNHYSKIVLVRESRAILEAEDETLIESSLGRLYQHLEDGDCIAIVSAFRANRKRAENVKLTKELRAYVLGAGFGYNRAVGGYTEKMDDGSFVEVVDEQSTIIYAKPEREKELRRFAESLGKKYDQDSVLFVDKKGNACWIFTRKPNWAEQEIGSVQNLGEFHPKQIGAYFTKIGKKNFSFVVNESEEVTRWSQCELKVPTVDMRGLDIMKKRLKECVENDIDFYETYFSKVDFAQ